MNVLITSIRKNSYVVIFHGALPLFGEVLLQAEDVRDGVVQIKGVGNSDDPKFLETVELNKRANTEPKLDFLKNASDHLSSYLRARVLHSLRAGDADVGKTINAALESASASGVKPPPPHTHPPPQVGSSSAIK